MPKAAMNKDDLATSGENKVGFSWQANPVLAVAIAQSMHKPAHRQFDAGVLASDEAHALAALAGTEGIHG